VLALIGLYGTVSYLVAQRQREFGIRLALGAEPGSILRLVMLDVISVVAVGLLAGISHISGSHKTASATIVQDRSSRYRDSRRGSGGTVHRGASRRLPARSPGDEYLRFVLLEVGGLVLHAAIAQFANATHRGYLENQVHGTLAPPQDLPDEVIEAQNRVAVNLNQLLFAISHHQFARENLRQMQREVWHRGCPDGESRSEWTIMQSIFSSPARLDYVSPPLTSTVAAPPS
jgi:hypothetical protein